MERNWPEIIAALERKAKDPSVPQPEREALTAKANELKEKYKVQLVPSFEELKQKVNSSRREPRVMSYEEFLVYIYNNGPTPTYERPIFFDFRYAQAQSERRWYDTVDLDEDPQQNEYKWGEENGDET